MGHDGACLLAVGRRQPVNQPNQQKKTACVPPSPPAGQLGTGDLVDRHRPTRVDLLPRVSSSSSSPAARRRRSSGGGKASADVARGGGEDGGAGARGGGEDGGVGGRAHGGARDAAADAADAAASVSIVSLALAEVHDR